MQKLVDGEHLAVFLCGRLPPPHGLPHRYQEVGNCKCLEYQNKVPLKFRIILRNETGYEYALKQSVLNGARSGVYCI